MAWFLSDFAAALAWAEQSLALAREMGDAEAETLALHNLAVVAGEAGDYDRAIASADAALAMALAASDAEYTAMALILRGAMAWEQGDPLAAISRYEEALALSRQHGFSWNMPEIFCGFGFAKVDLGDYVGAEGYLREALDLAHARGNLAQIIPAMEGLARVGAATGQSGQAARLLEAAAKLREEIDMPRTPTQVAYLAPVLDALRDAMGPGQFATARAAGRALAREDAIAEARAVRAEPALSLSPTVTDASAAPPELTAREREILRLSPLARRTA